MSDYYEIDFLAVGEGKSGDAIAIRYHLSGETTIHVVDGGFQQTGPELVKHIKKYYGSPSHIDRVVLTHHDGDHSGGLPALFESFKIGELWMLKPWDYADELIDKFDRLTSAENLKKRLRDLYPNIVTLEELANEKHVLIKEPFQGEKIGDFTVLSPSKKSYLHWICNSARTPETTESGEKSLTETFVGKAKETGRKIVNFVRSIWGQEIFPDDDTSSENNMSIVQFAELCEEKILLTGDAGRGALLEAITYAPNAGLTLPGINTIQIPHHGSRHNVSSVILDALLGPKLDSQSEKFMAIASAARDDKDHPRKAVVRAFIHRGAKVLATKGISTWIQVNAPPREGWRPVDGMPYPDEQEGA